MSLWLPNKTRLLCTMVEFKDLSGLKQFRVFFDSRWYMFLSFIRNGWHTDFQKNANAEISSEIVFIDPDVLLSNPDGPTHLASGWNHTDKRVENCWLMGEIQVYDSEFNKMTTWHFSTDSRISKTKLMHTKTSNKLPVSYCTHKQHTFMSMWYPYQQVQEVYIVYINTKVLQSRIVAPILIFCLFSIWLYIVYRNQQKIVLETF